MTFRFCYYILILTKDNEVIVLVTDKAGKIFEDRRKDNVEVKKDRRKANKKKENKKK